MKCCPASSCRDLRYNTITEVAAVDVAIGASLSTLVRLPPGFQLRQDCIELTRECAGARERGSARQQPVLLRRS